MATCVRSSLLILLIASFSVGWRGDPSPYFYPVSMTLDASRMFVSDLGTGVRVFDVADPAAPAEIAVIPLHGNRGTAVKDGILYANEYEALVVLREVDGSWTEIARLGDTYDEGFFEGGGTNGFKGPVPYDGGFACSCTTGEMQPAAEPRGGSSSYGTFALIDDYLYHVDYSALVTYDVSDPAKPVELARREIGWPIETLHPAGGLLFIGGTRGMYVFDRSDPANPKQIGRIEHFRACDPVVVSGSVAYVTLRGGNGCGDTRDALLCVDITDPAAPKLIVEKALVTPHGLVVRDPYLYVSNGYAGFTLLNVAQPATPVVVANWTARPTRDFLWEDTVLYVLGEDGVHVFDASDPVNPVHLATAGPAIP